MSYGVQAYCTILKDRAMGLAQAIDFLTRSGLKNGKATPLYTPTETNKTILPTPPSSG